MTEWFLDRIANRNAVLLATAGNDYGPQFGAALPASYYWEPRILDCGHSEEDCDGIECGRLPQHSADQVTEADVAWALDEDREFVDQEYVDWLGFELAGRWEDK